MNRIARTAAAILAAAAITATATPADAATTATKWTNCGHGVSITKGGSCAFARNVVTGIIANEADNFDIFTVYSPTTKKRYKTFCYVQDGRTIMCHSGKGYRQAIRIRV